MIGNKKVIGVCMTKIQSTSRTRMILHLHREAAARGYKLMVFNSTFEFSYDLNEKICAAEIYDFINFEIVDALIVLCSGFIDKTVYKKIVDKAATFHVPVILEDEEYGEAYSVVNDLGDSYFELLNHVIVDHNVRDTFFIAGVPGNSYSEERIEVYKRVLEANGLPYSEENVDYGYFWGNSAIKVLDKLFQRQHLPEAIFCANDIMAEAVISELGKRGIQVPGRVLVTGFDGGISSLLSEVQITTCVLDQERFAKTAMDLLAQVFDGQSPEHRIELPFFKRMTESCGCCKSNKVDYVNLAQYYYKLTQSMLGHEMTVYNDIIYRLNAENLDINTFYNAMSGIMDVRDNLILHPSFLNKLIHMDQVEIDVPAFCEEELIAISPDERYQGKEARFPAKDIIPFKESWAEDSSLYVISSVQVGKETFGYYECMTNDIIMDAHKINRVLVLINMLFHMAVSDVRQRFLKTQHGKDSMIDSVTELANLRGVTEWYKEFLADSSNAGKITSFSIYEIPKYRYIYENFGIQEVEACVCFVAEALRVANPKDCLISHITEDEFLIINYYDSLEEVSRTINNATTVFYGLIDRFNRGNRQEYYLEVCAGCISGQYNDEIRIETLIQAAIGEMYKNKIIYGSASAKKEEIVTAKEQYELFRVLMAENMFDYHFQPIVDAKTGEIYAYESLMRTPANIGLNPMQILNIAREYQRLYDVEKATIFNTMARYRKDYEKFKGRKVFINCIPGHSLTSEDNAKLSELYADYSGSFVYEITEQDSISDFELNSLRTLGNYLGNNAIAVDDYGTGHSNIVNLIKYAPEIVKIDRFIISDINNDPNKQIIVKGVIEYAASNNIKVLAEGVETEAEMIKVIELGVDYIQGYYTGKPAYEPIERIEESIQKVIIETAGKTKHAV